MVKLINFRKNYYFKKEKEHMSKHIFLMKDGKILDEPLVCEGTEYKEHKNKGKL